MFVCNCIDKNVNMNTYLTADSSNSSNSCETFFGQTSSRVGGSRYRKVKSRNTDSFIRLAADCPLVTVRIVEARLPYRRRTMLDSRSCVHENAVVAYFAKYAQVGQTSVPKPQSIEHSVDWNSAPEISRIFTGYEN